MTYNSFEDALSSKPDIVIIATPHAMHAGQAIRALRAGAHVLCEKPNERFRGQRQAHACRSACQRPGLHRGLQPALPPHHAPGARRHPFRRAWATSCTCTGISAPTSHFSIAAHATRPIWNALSSSTTCTSRTSSTGGWAGGRQPSIRPACAGGRFAAAIDAQCGGADAGNTMAGCWRRSISTTSSIRSEHSVRSSATRSG